MLKITELKEERLRTVHKRNSFGKLEKSTEKYIDFRKVKEVSGFKRMFGAFIDQLAIFPMYPLFYILKIDWIFSIIIYLLYYILLELFLQRTLGKYITGSIVINEYAQKPDFNIIFIRTILRLIPFDAFSFLINERGWHDKYSNTYVISKKEYSDLKELISRQGN